MRHESAGTQTHSVGAHHIRFVPKIFFFFDFFAPGFFVDLSQIGELRIGAFSGRIHRAYGIWGRNAAQSAAFAARGILRDFDGFATRFASRVVSRRKSAAYWQSQ